MLPIALLYPIILEGLFRPNAVWAMFLKKPPCSQDFSAQISKRSLDPKAGRYPTRFCMLRTCLPSPFLQPLEPLPYISILLFTQNLKNHYITEMYFHVNGVTSQSTRTALLRVSSYTTDARHFRRASKYREAFRCKAQHQTAVRD